MRRTSLKALALAAILGAASSLQAQEKATLTLDDKASEPIAAQKTEAKGKAKVEAKTEAPKLATLAVGESAGCCTNGCSDCCNQGGIFAEFEVLFLEYRRRDGTRTGNTSDGPENLEDVDPSYEMVPRITIGYLTGSGLGYRLRYSNYGHRVGISEDGPDESLDVNTYTIDAEVFKSNEINCKWTVESALGIRYNRFEELMIDGGDIRFNRFHGFGAVASLEARRSIGESFAVYGRVRGSVLFGGKHVFNENLTDNDPQETTQDRRLDRTLGTVELSAGAEYRRTLGNGWKVFARASGEFQNWLNFSSAFVDDNSSEQFAGGSNVSFAGFGFSLGITR